MSVHNYESAAAYLGSKQDRPIGTGRATRIIRRTPEAIGIRYHATDVVTYYADGSIMLNSDGYQTVTTKARINEYTSARVWSERGIFRVTLGGYGEGGKTYAYQDRMRLVPSDVPGAKWGEYRIEYAEGSKPPAADELRQKELNKRIAEYARKFGEAVKSGEVEFPGPGDCWGCLMKDANASKSDPFDFPMLGVGHLLSHMNIGADAEWYFVPSLLFRAFGRRGNPAFVYQMCIDRKDGAMAAAEIRWYLRKLAPKLLAALPEEV